MIDLVAGQIDDNQTDALVDATLERAKREVAILEQVDVPFLARSGPLGLNRLSKYDEKWLYFTEEWIDGVSLTERLRNRTIETTEVVHLARDLIQSACWLHEHGLIHRDIKPGNIMWSEKRERFVLIDYGLAFDLHGTALTRFPDVVGTAAYISPEQLNATRKSEMDFRSDLFAIGIVLYEAATGSHPFDWPAQSYQVVTKILHADPVPVSARNDALPPSLAALITRLLGKEPHMRYRTCAHAIAAVDEAIREVQAAP